MARPRKKGLDYIPLDVHFFDDRRVRKLNSKYKGGRASFVYLLLISEIAQDGFYIKLTEDDLRFFAHESGIQRKVFNQIIWDLIENEFFDKELYEKYNILTSEEIQRHYFSIKNSKSSVEITSTETTYLLVDISKYKNVTVAENEPKNSSFQLANSIKTDQNPTENQPLNDGNRTENPPKNGQDLTENQPNSFISKVKNSKEKKSIDKENKFSVQNRTENGLHTQTNFSDKEIDWFKKEILNRFPDYLRPENLSDQVKWFEDYHRLRQKLSHEEIVKIIDFGLRDKFWKKILVSLSILLKNSDSDGVPNWKKLKAQITPNHRQIQRPASVQADISNIKIIG